MKNVTNRMTVLMLVTAAAGQATAIDKSWFAAAGNWNVPGSWTPLGVPNPGDNVFIGNLPIAYNATVTINNNTSISGLSITDGMTLNTNVSRLTVNGPTTVSGVNVDGAVSYRSRLRVEQSAMPSDAVLEALTASNGANIDINGGATMDVQGVFNLEDTATLSADGIINLSASGVANAMMVNGSIAISASPTGLVINQNGTGRIDLDGTLADDREINITARTGAEQFAKLTINGDRLTDSFSEIITLGGRNSLTMNLSDGWTMGPGSTLRFQNSVVFPGPSNVYGSELTIEGEVRVTGAGAEATIYAPVVLDSSAQIELADFTQLNFEGDTTINGGSFDIGASAGVFLEDDTVWDGTVTIVGGLHQNGDATVSGATTINADNFDMDGSALSNWTINAPLVINADNIDYIGSNFDGTISVSGTSSRLEINLADPEDFWVMDGEMTLSAPLFISTTRLAGSPVHIHGTLNASGRARLDTDVRWVSGSTTNMGTTTTECEVVGEGMIEQGATFAGGGYIATGPAGHLTLGHGANLGNTGVRNDGVVSVGPVAGSATVRGFAQSATGELRFQIGGSVPSTQHDVLFVNGPSGAELDGVLRVELLEVDGVPYLPNVGASFLVFSASSVSGTFDAIPDTVVGGWTVAWQPVYGPNTVWVRAVSVSQSCGADFNQDGFIDFFDYDDFVNCFENGVCPVGKTADFNSDGFVDFFDYSDFVTAFESGC